MRVKIEKLDNFGRGIAYVNGRIIFIDNALPDEEVDIVITKENKKYLEGKVTKYLKLSPNRTEALCPYYSICGGCHLQHLSIALENAFKEEKIKSILKKFASTESTISPIKTLSPYFYRNKITLHVQNKKIGYYQNNTNNLVEIDYCPLANKRINSLFKPLQQLALNNDLEEIMLRSSNDEKEVLLKLTGRVTNYQDILNLVDVLVINDKVITKKAFIETKIGTKSYRLSSLSFFQVNKELTKYLYDEVLQVVKNNSFQKALDLYCGTGTISLYISDFLQEVIGIDYNKANIEAANINKDLNNTKNTTFICAKVENVISNYQNIDLIIVDPPRAGLNKIALDTIIKIKPRCLVYISCDVSTLARDLNILKNTYSIALIKPFNMFPRTYHIECVCVLTLK